ncbi:hypothetical protein GGR56DRAFT_678212 [Xylariaceae sp. FL0804]|nr:hypothetical protein GGR56DRAFT_678212 [Xylariaceae sp. FL0804]
MIKEMDLVELIIRKAISQSTDGKITRNEFLNEAAKITRLSFFTPMEADILFHFASLDEPSKVLTLLWNSSPSSRARSPPRLMKKAIRAPKTAPSPTRTVGLSDFIRMKEFLVVHESRSIQNEDRDDLNSDEPKPNIKREKLEDDVKPTLGRRAVKDEDSKEDVKLSSSSRAKQEVQGENVGPKVKHEDGEDVKPKKAGNKTEVDEV